MGKVAPSSTKYVIEARLESSGTVEKPDVIGAIFGQTEGLLGDDMDLRELQERGRIGRIHVRVKTNNGSSTASIKIPSSLDSTNTAILAAALETIDRVGPTDASIKVKRVRDERVSKQDYIVERARELLSDIEQEKPSQAQITTEVKHRVRTGEITEHHGFEAGPGVEQADEIVLVEGRADLLNLLKHGVKNAAALGGTGIPSRVKELVGSRQTTVFLDGDRGGDLILKELDDHVEVDFVARAPDKKEVEELGKETVHECLRDRKKPELEELEKEA